MVATVTPSCVQMNGSVKEMMPRATTSMNQNTIIWSATLVVVMTTFVMGLRVICLLAACYG